jgi:hypothetical protein
MFWIFAVGFFKKKANLLVCNMWKIDTCPTSASNFFLKILYWTIQFYSPSFGRVAPSRSELGKLLIEKGVNLWRKIIRSLENFKLVKQVSWFDQHSKKQSVNFGTRNSYSPRFRKSTKNKIKLILVFNFSLNMKQSSRDRWDAHYVYAAIGSKGRGFESQSADHLAFFRTK